MAVNYNRMTMAQLKAELSKRNLQVSGKKSELVARLDENDRLIKGEEAKQLSDEKQQTKMETEVKKEIMNTVEELKEEEDPPEIKEKVKVEEMDEADDGTKDLTKEDDSQNAEEATDVHEQEDDAVANKEAITEEPTTDKVKEEVTETEPGDNAEKKLTETDATDIIHQIDDLISDEVANDEETVTENKDTVDGEEMVETSKDIKEGKSEENTEASEENVENSEEIKKEEDKAKEEDEVKEEKTAETKVSLKTDDFDFTKSATGFVIALDNGKDVVIPVKDMLKIDMKSRRQSKTVLAYPLSIEDLTSGKLNDFVEKCCHFTISFHQYSHEKVKSTKGYAEFIFATDEEAHEQADLMAEMNDDLVVRQLSRKDKPTNTYNDIPQELITVNNMLKKYIYIGNLPSTATEEELQALFPESNNLAVIVNNEGLPKGYALAELPTTEAVDEAVKKSMKINYPGYENKLLILRTWSKVPKGLLDSSTRKDLLDKIRNLRKLRMKCTDDIARNRIENDMAMMKMRLDKDCKARDEIGLPVPPDIVRLEEAKAAKRDPDKNKDKTGANISTIQRGNKPARRGVGGTITTAGTFGNNQGFKKNYQNQGARGARQNYRGGNQGFRGGNQGFRQGSNQGFRSGNQGYQNNNQGYQGGYQGAKQGFGAGNLGAKQGFGNSGYGSGRQGFGQGYGSSYGNPKQGYGGGYDGTKQGYGGGQCGSEPGMNNAVEMLMQVSKMLGTNQKPAGTGYGNQGFNSTNQGTGYPNTFGNQGNFGNQGSNFGGSFGGNRGGGFSGGYKRRGDDVGYGGGGKRNTGYYNQKRW